MCSSDLNRVPPSWGGQAPALAVDGLIGPKTNGAIRNFQQIQLGTIFNPDGRVDHGRRTSGRLNHIWDSAERPGGSFNSSEERRVGKEWYRTCTPQWLTYN